jgi:hypothetical protein
VGEHLKRAYSFRYLKDLQRHTAELAASPRGMDALELPRDARACRGMMGRCLAEKIDSDHGG